MPAAQDSDAIKDSAVNSSEVKKTAEHVADAPAPILPPRRKRHYFLWSLFVLLIAAFLWLATSSNPFAEGFQELAGNKHDQAVVNVPFTLSPHNFRYYKFSLPEASTNVAIVGDFTATPGDDKRRNTGHHPLPDAENGIEIYVLTETSFAIWQTGYATSSIFQSERVAQGTFQADLPAGAGVYYLVFSNKFSSRATKKVDATVVLRYKSWAPGWLRRIGDYF